MAESVIRDEFVPVWVCCRNRYGPEEIKCINVNNRFVNANLIHVAQERRAVGTCLKVAKDKVSAAGAGETANGRIPRDLVPGKFPVDVEGDVLEFVVQGHCDVIPLLVLHGLRRGWSVCTSIGIISIMRKYSN